MREIQTEIQRDTTEIRASRSAKASNIKSAATGAVIGAVNKGTDITGKIGEFSNNSDTSTNVADTVKETAEKSAEKATQTAIKTAKNAKRTIKNIHNAAKHENRVIQTSTNRAIKTSSKAVKETAKTAKETSKTAAKTTEQAAKATAKASEAAEQAVAKGLKAAVGFFVSPPGLITLAIVGGVVLIVVIFNMISGAIQVPISAISGAGSSLSWLFGGDTDPAVTTDDSNIEDISELYNDFYSIACEAMADVRTNYNNQIAELNFGDRDKFTINGGGSYYPASAAQSYLTYFINTINYSDYVYLMQLCYIVKLRAVRIEQGLPEDEQPENVTLTKDDLYSFLINYCFTFSLTTVPHQSCPTSDCLSGTWYHPNGYCTDAPEGSDTCIGHTYYFCNCSHKKVDITIYQTPKDVLENDLLSLTDSEKSLLSIGTALLNQALEAAAVTTEP